ncbi:MAG TPA: hypothetical protein DDZ51_07885 [Planctomycetaceae bacterium]|nr:hypothetical protein [Planctomycetaceae bacterium]
MLTVSKPSLNDHLASDDKPVAELFKVNSSIPLNRFEDPYEEALFALTEAQSAMRIIYPLRQLFQLIDDERTSTLGQLIENSWKMIQTSLSKGFGLLAIDIPSEAFEHNDCHEAVFPATVELLKVVYLQEQVIRFALQIMDNPNSGDPQVNETEKMASECNEQLKLLSKIRAWYEIRE